MEKLGPKEVKQLTQVAEKGLKAGRLFFATCVLYFYALLPVPTLCILTGNMMWTCYGNPQH